MQLSSRTDIAAPLAFVHAALADFDHWERAARRRGADVTRIDTRGVPAQGESGPGQSGPGLSWTVQFAFRGKVRIVDIRLVALQNPGKLSFAGKGRQLDGDMTIDLVALGPDRTRLVTDLTARPLTIGARLMLQSVALARGRAQARLDGWLQTLGADLERRHAGSGPV